MDDTQRRYSVRMPELGIEDAVWTLSVWLVPLGARVVAGDRIVEIVAGQAVVDLPAPGDGVLVEQLVAEDDAVQAGQILGWVECVRAVKD